MATKFFDRQGKPVKYFYDTEDQNFCFKIMDGPLISIPGWLMDQIVDAIEHNKLKKSRS